MPGAQKKGQPRVVGLYIGGGAAARRVSTLSGESCLRVLGDVQLAAMFRSACIRKLPQLQS